MSKTKQIVFDSFELMVNRREPDLDFLHAIIDSPKDFYEHNELKYKREQCSMEGSFFWIYFRCGNQYPYCDKVLNPITKEEIENPRDKSLVELDTQIFLMYNINDGSVYINNLRKKSFFISYFIEVTGMEIDIKNIYKNVDEFIQAIDTINEISFVTKRNLQSYDNDIFKDAIDVFGLGNPEQMRVEASFGKARKSEEFKEKFKKLFADKEQGRVDKLICVGRNDSGLESILNTNTLISKFSIDSIVDENNLFVPEDVLTTLIKRLEGN